MFKEVFVEMGLSDYAHRIYIQLLENGASSARHLSEVLSIPRPSVYDNLNLLIKKGLVVERNEENKKIFQVDDVKNLPKLVKGKIEFLEKEKKKIDAALPTLAKQAESVEPRIKFYSGAEGVKQVLNDVLWHENIQTFSIWPISEMIEVLGRDYFIKLNKARIRQKIDIKVVWPQDKVVNFKDYPFMGVGRGFYRDVRTAPKGITWSMGFWLYEDKVAFLSSKKELFGFVVHSKDFTNLLKTLFSILWKVSKRLPPQPKYTDKFLETI